MIKSLKATACTIGWAELVRMSGYRGWYGLKNPSFLSFLVSVDRKIMGPTASSTWKGKLLLYLLKHLWLLKVIFTCKKVFGYLDLRL